MTSTTVQGAPTPGVVSQEISSQDQAPESSSFALPHSESVLKRPKLEKLPHDEETFDHVLNILEAHNHPWIGVGLVSTRWMGCRGQSDCMGIDLLIRDDQISSIAASILQIGYWIPAVAPEIEENAIFSTNDLIRDADVAFERACIKKDFHLNLLRLWSEKTFHLKVDTDELVEVPDIYAWGSALVEGKWHPAANRTDGWLYGPDSVSEVFPPGRCSKRGKREDHPTPVFISTIPRYLEALVYQRTHYNDTNPNFSSLADWQIDLLIRYLYLESPHQAIPMEFEVDGPTEIHLTSRFKRYVRKPVCVISNLGGKPSDVLVKLHDPTTFPQDKLDSRVESRGKWRGLQKIVEPDVVSFAQRIEWRRKLKLLMLQERLPTDLGLSAKALSIIHESTSEQKHDIMGGH